MEDTLVHSVEHVPYCGQYFWQCKNCDHPFYMSPLDIPNFCPNCGVQFTQMKHQDNRSTYLTYVKDKAHVDKILVALEKNDGYCPCRLEKNEDTVCPCKEYRETGHCHCGLYESFEVS